MENQLEEVDQSIVEIENRMQSTNDPGQLIDDQKELDLLNQKQESLMLEWEEIGTQLDL